ncbi:MAG: hypothetical protein GEU79_12510 [Acidimicrobiia bacterium]|nr:hypothetical protein [Acidimicrobiia bacterium]
MAAFRDAGFFGEDPVGVNGVEVAPREVFNTLIEPKIQATDDYEDVVINRGVGTGEIDGEKKLTLDVITWPPEDLPFTAMQAATGWHAAIICQRLAAGEVGPRVVEVENAAGEELLGAFRDRGSEVNET